MLRKIADKIADATVVLSFAAPGYALRKRTWKSVETDLTGRVVVVTGANSGIGFATTRKLASLGATVVMGCRSMDRAREARAQLISGQKLSAEPIIEKVDVSDMSSVAAFGERLREQFGTVDVLVNNAGVLLDERRESVDGHELTFATNVLGGFLLTRVLRPALARSPDGRVIHVSSGGMYTQKLNLRILEEGPSPFDGVAAYAQTKRAQVILNEFWAEALAEDNVLSLAMHPGWANTPGVERSLPRFHTILEKMLRTPAQGADTVIWLAASTDEGKLESGKFYFDREPRKTHVMGRTRASDDVRRALWERCMELTAPWCAEDEPETVEHQSARGTNQ